MRFVFSILAALIISIHAEGSVNIAKYGILNKLDSAAIEQITTNTMDSLLSNHSMLSAKIYIDDIETIKTNIFSTFDFYTILSLCLFLGFIRFIDLEYFKNLGGAFINGTSPHNQLRKQLEDSGLPDFLMNVFFILSIGIYLNYLVQFHKPFEPKLHTNHFIPYIIIVATGLFYLAKFLILRFSGWAFQVAEITEYYLFNVFLINKIIGIVLIPFIIILVFGDKLVGKYIIITSIVLVSLLLIIRYVRSWQFFSSFFRFSKFHFLLYLCTSELLPLAILSKIFANNFLL